MQAFNLKYKPYLLRDFNFDVDFLGMIEIMISMNVLNILFIGNTGTCKTTFLHAVIRQYYGLLPADPLPENNILFINNLKEQGINYYRTEMKMFCQSHTNIRGKNKIVVIDDIDTINEQSQQVFRNCMDKYKNIHFISSCSNIQKVIESIQSRLQIVKIPPYTQEHMKCIMNHIIDNERICMEADAVEFIMNISNDSIRVLINYLEKIYILTAVRGGAGAVVGETPTPVRVSFQMCNKICTDISFKVFEDYTMCVKNRELTAAIRILYDICDYGYSVIDILDNYFLFVKITTVLTEEEKYVIIPHLCKYITVFHNIHEDSVELALFTRSIELILAGMKGTVVSSPV
jgi:DNA polymerase III delta prime subunit